LHARATFIARKEYKYLNKKLSIPMVKLFVGGFPLDISEVELVKLFIPHGDIATVKIVRNKKTGTCKGYAFVEMKDQQSADRAIDALDYCPMNDRLLTVRLVEPAEPDVTSSGFAGSQAAKLKYVNPSSLAKKKRPRRAA
jgi:RNA recognition motif-containing protein